MSGKLFRHLFSLDRGMKSKKNIFRYFIFIMIAFVFSGCSHPFSPPEINFVKQFICDHETDLAIVTDYLIGLQYSTVSIRGSDGIAYADLEYIMINREDVLKSLAAVNKDGCKMISKDLESNCIEFVLWVRTFDEADCGFLYVIDREKEPSVQFQTELIPLDESRWYFYMAEYNKWRTQQAKMSH